MKVKFLAQVNNRNTNVIESHDWPIPSHHCTMSSLYSSWKYN